MPRILALTVTLVCLLGCAESDVTEPPATTGGATAEADPAGPATDNENIKTEEVRYQHGDLECHGYLAWDDSVEGPRPGVLVLHEWWGLNDYARERTRQLAELGYLAFAADIYGEGKTVDHPQDAGAMSGKVRENVADWRQRAVKALEVLKARPNCLPDQVAAIGYCFGGATALQLGYTGADLKSIATFHAALPTPSDAEAEAIKAEVLICHGADDTFVSEEAVNSLKEQLSEADVEFEFIAYPGARHSFTVPSADEHGLEGLKYDEAADRKSWEEMKQLFERTLQAE